MEATQKERIKDRIKKRRQAELEGESKMRSEITQKFGKLKDEFIRGLISLDEYSVRLIKRTF